MRLSRAVCLSCLVVFGATRAIAQLPPESRVPGDATQGVITAPGGDATGIGAPGEPAVGARLPGEGELPTSYSFASRQREQIASPSDDAGFVEEMPPAQPDTPPQDLPDEGRLPPGAGDAQDADNQAAGGRLPLEGSPDGIPWLRLDMRGHTAPVRALSMTADGSRLATAGDDKTAVLWAAVPAGGQGGWRYDRTVRWQVQRGTRGRVYALDSAPGVLAIAGEGAMGGVGEILLVDPQSGDLQSALYNEQNGHRQVVVDVDFAGEGANLSLASISMDGKTLLWTRDAAGLWTPRVLLPDDQSAGVDAATAERLLAARQYLSVVALPGGRVVAPVYDRTESNRIVWRLELVDSAGRRTKLEGAPHFDFVTALAASADGRRVASADGVGAVYLWDFSQTRPTAQQVRKAQSPQVLSLDLNANGGILLLGTTVNPATSKSSVEVWRVDGQPSRAVRYQASDNVFACGLDASGRLAAWTDGDASVVKRLTDNSPLVALRAPIRTPLRVAFPTEAPFYRIGIGTTRDGDSTPITSLFDADLVQLDRSERPIAARWLPTDWLNQGWEVRTVAEADGQQAVYFFQNGERRARTAITEGRHGALQEVCWIPARAAGEPPLAAAIGTSSGAIFLYAPSAEGDAKLIRQFRGHSGAITSLGVSRDLVYLASGSTDGTVGVWPLRIISRDEPMINRWGATFETRDGRLFVASIRDEGPLYFRGVRQGDELVELKWNEGRDLTQNAPSEMATVLADVGSDTLMKFTFQTGRQPARSFQILPYWQQLASLFVADNGEWAYWTPAGYYDASFEGHKLFGWQINRGLDSLPDFFLAARFRQILERPAVMSQLLRAGSLEAAFRAARLEAPADSPEAVVNAYRMKPSVAILAPQDGATVDQRIVPVRAEITIPRGQRLAPPKAFANGVVGQNRRLVADEEVDGRRRLTYEWDLAAPSDRRLMIQVVAATQSEVSAVDQVVVENLAPKPTEKPKLMVVAVGVGAYRDAQIPRLKTPANSAARLTELLTSGGAAIYRPDAVTLAENNATRPAWEYLTEQAAAEMRDDVSPDDLLVIFLSGHGVRSLEEGGFQYLTADARYADVLAGQFGGCLSFTDFARFSDIPCRKLVILDTCHGGAIEPLRRRDMKTAIRALQDDVLLTLAASGGAEEAVEGRFSSRLFEALSGAADQDGGDRDGATTLSEVVAYVQRTVAADSARDDRRQMPAAGPMELAPYVELPLVGVEQRPVAGIRAEPPLR